MTGKNNIDFNSLVADFSFFSGNDTEIFSFLKNILFSLFNVKQIKIIKIPHLTQNSEYKKHINWLLSNDNCIQIFSNSDFSKEFISIFNIPPSGLSIPIRRKLYDSSIIALICIPNCDSALQNKVLILSGIAGYKLENYYISNQRNDFMKYYNIGKLSQDVFHEIKNKLIAPSTFLQTINLRYNDKNFRENFSKLSLEEIKQIQVQINKIMKLSKQDSSEDDYPISFYNIVSHCLLLVEHEIRKMNITVDINIDQEIYFPLKNQDLKDVFFNLLLNSVEALRNNTIKKIIIKTFSFGKNYGFEISDSGSGIDKNEIDSIFDAFFTTKKKGTGLGLNIVKRLIESHKGEITVSSIPDKKTSFTITFPKN